MNRLWDEVQILAIELFFFVRGAIRLGNDYLRLACLLWASGPVGAFLSRVIFGKIALLMESGSFAEWLFMGLAKWGSLISALMPLLGFVVFFWYAGPILLIANELLPDHFAGMHPSAKAKKIREEVMSITGLCTIIALVLALAPTENWVYGTLVALAIIVGSAFYNESLPHFKVSWWAWAIAIFCAAMLILGGPDEAQARWNETVEQVGSVDIDFGSGTDNGAPPRIVVEDGRIPILYPGQQTNLMVAAGATTGCIPPAPGDVHLRADVVNTARTAGRVTMVQECDVAGGIPAVYGQPNDRPWMYSFQIVNESDEPVLVTVHSYSE